MKLILPMAQCSLLWVYVCVFADEARSVLFAILRHSFKRRGGNYDWNQFRPAESSARAWFSRFFASLCSAARSATWDIQYWPLENWSGASTPTALARRKIFGLVPSHKGALAFEKRMKKGKEEKKKKHSTPTSIAHSKSRSIFRFYCCQMNF